MGAVDRLKYLLVGVLVAMGGLYMFFQLKYLQKRPLPSMPQLHVESLIKKIEMRGKARYGAWRLLSSKVYVKENSNIISLSNPELFFFTKGKEFFFRAKRGKYNRTKNVLHAWMDVVGRYREVKITCEEAYYMLNVGKIELSKGVKINSNSFHIQCNKAIIYINAKEIFFDGNLNFTIISG